MFSKIASKFYKYKEAIEVIGAVVTTEEIIRNSYKAFNGSKS